jgi:hypothetical protein
VPFSRPISTMRLPAKPTTMPTSPVTARHSNKIVHVRQGYKCPQNPRQ